MKVFMKVFIQMKQLNVKIFYVKIGTAYLNLNDEACLNR